MTPLETWLSGISAGFITAIVWLARYIRDMHNKQIAREEIHTATIVGLVENNSKIVAENTTVNEKMRLTIDNNTVITQRSAEQIERSQDRLGETLKKLNKPTRGRST